MTQHNQDPREQLEQELSKQLTEGQMEQEDPSNTAVRRLPPRWNAVIKAETDPVAEETKRYRGMAEEVDDRYDRYS